MQKMSEIETQIMTIVWESAEPVSPSSLLSEFNEKYRHTWTPQALCTYLFRMAGKGLVFYKRIKNTARYYPLISKDQYLRFIVDELYQVWGDDLLDAIEEKRKTA